MRTARIYRHRLARSARDDPYHSTDGRVRREARHQPRRHLGGARASPARRGLSREWLGTTLRRYLRGIEISDGVRLSIAICKAADAGDEIADAALWDVGRELIERPTGRPGDLQILAYYQRAGRHSPRRRRGRQWHDDWYRNLCICLLVELACKEFGVRPTRNRESRRGGREPSGCSLVAAGLARNKARLDEATIQRHLWLGLPGALVRQALAERPIESYFSSV